MMKWIKNGIRFERGNYEPLIVKFDNSKVWLKIDACCTQQSARKEFRELGEAYGAKTIEVQKMYNDDGVVSHEDIVCFLDLGDKYIFRNELEVPEGVKREFIRYSEDEIFC